jgi:signal peptidase II
LVIAAGVAAAVVVADQVTKSWAESRLAAGPVHVIGSLDLALQFNTGSAFSLFQGRVVVLVVVAIALAAVLARLAWTATTRSTAVAFGLMLGGALGNLSDRLFRGNHGAVVDFVELHFWPTFNLADSCIVAGAMLLLLSLWNRRRL